MLASMSNNERNKNLHSNPPVCKAGLKTWCIAFQCRL